MLDFINIFDFELFSYSFQRAGIYSAIILVMGRVFSVILILYIIYYSFKAFVRLLSGKSKN